MFSKVLIANRGEIACRIVRTRAPAGHPHRRRVFGCRRRRAARASGGRGGGASARRRRATATCAASVIIEAARRTGAQAIHPGYGFLSENEDFARACAPRRHRLHRAAAGGDPRHGLQVGGQVADGSKPACRWCPATTARTRPRDCCSSRPTRIGYPVLIKASAGGGGKGMRRVDAPTDFAAALASCQREAQAAFGDDARADRELPAAAAPHRNPGLRRYGTATACICSSAIARCSAVTRRCSRRRLRPA